MEDTKDVDIPVILDEVRDSVVAVEQYPYVTRCGGVARPELREIS